MPRETIYRPSHTNLGGGMNAGTGGGMDPNWNTTGMGTNWATTGAGSTGAGANWGPAGTTAGWGAAAAGMQPAGGQKFGAHEMMEVHEVLTDHIDGINQFELYRPHVKDQELMSILDKQVQHMSTSYDNMVGYLQNQGMTAAVPYRMKKNFQPKYGLRQPSPQQPNTGMHEMDDRDVASGMMGCAKASAILCTNAALECADPNLRSMMVNCSVSSVNQAYEVFQYMNRKGMYQVPTMQQNTTNTMMNTYQSAGNMPAPQ